MGRRCNATGGERIVCPGRCTIADSNRSIPRHLRSFMNTKQTRRLRSLMAVFPRSLVFVFFFFSFFNDVQVLVKKTTREKMSARQSWRISHEFFSCLMQKSSANITTKFQSSPKDQGKILKSILSAGSNFLTSSLFLLLVCKFFIRKKFSRCSIVFLTLDISCSQQLIVAETFVT